MAMDGADSRARSLVGLGWLVSFLLTMAELVANLASAAIRDDFSAFLLDPGEAGLEVLAGAMCLHAAFMLAVRLFDARWFRWLNAVLLAVLALLALAHQVAHLANGGMAPAQHMIVTTQYLTGCVVTIWAVNWAKAGGR